MQDVSGIALVDEELWHHEVCDDDEDNHGVVLVDGVDTLEVPIHESYRRETLLWWCVDVLNGVKMTFLGLAGLSSIGKFAPNGIDYTSNLLCSFL